jgi:hypothetical protein
MTLLLPLQVFEHRAITAAKIEHPRTRGNPVRDEGQISAQTVKL